MSKKNRTVIEGEYTDATVYLPEEEIEDGAYQQIQEMVDHPAFRNPVRIMPDSHQGAGAVIGFTTPITDRVVVNSVGVDCGCGMYAFKLNGIDYDLKTDDGLKTADKAIRANVPMGVGQMNSRNDYHMRDDFPWDEVQDKWEEFSNNHLDGNIELGEFHPDKFQYGVDYAQNVCKKVGYSFTDLINSCGTLGSGNHFIELSESANGDIWCVIHSGSRGIGYNISDYHQKRAENVRNLSAVRTALSSLYGRYGEYIKPDIDSISDEELHKWIHNRQIVDYDKLKDEFAGTENANLIEKISNVINAASRGHFNEVSNYIMVDVDELEAMQKSDELAYLEKEEAVEYYVDMAFAQTYASVNRREMGKRVAQALGADIVDEIESVHNYIDYNDGILRKGATPARKGERGVIPMNMSYGTLMVEGKGNEEWNFSAPHGAGRRMSRTQAHEELDLDEFKEEMGDTIASALPLDESPMAYKDVHMVKNAMEPTVEIIDHLRPLVSIKADD